MVQCRWGYCAPAGCVGTCRGRTTGGVEAGQDGAETVRARHRSADGLDWCSIGVSGDAALRPGPCSVEGFGSVFRMLDHTNRREVDRAGGIDLLGPPDSSAR
ncbi:hypothetical protein BUH_7400 [Burkholderia pseudomallei Pakistan 9]|nr:hypothetical protein BUH_7400 [Burkholderia pseudomallei Pakistan 9]